ncbi:MAG: DUF2849 domain-containing protein [Kiloniellaceae bacterium]
MTAKVVTANRLNDGVVVYLDPAGGWSEWIEEARIAHGPEESAELMTLAERADQATRVVGPYLMEVIEDAGRPRPASNREIIRAKGPTVRTDLGKQALRP